MNDETTIPHDRNDERWRPQAKCAGEKVDRFFPEVGVNIGHLKKFCSDCPVVRECLDYSLKYVIDHGVWGGMSPRERRDIRTGKVAHPYAAVRR